MSLDKEIWDDFRRGENDALSKIYHKYVQMLFRYGRKFSNDEELIKDTIQDLFFDLIRSRSTLGATDNILFYLMASFKRKLVKNTNQKNGKKLINESDLNVAIIYSAEHEMIDRESHTHKEALVKRALNELSPKQREILFYKFSCNFDYPQICELMKLQYDSARKQVFRALKSLKEILEDSDIFLFYFCSGTVGQFTELDLNV